MQRIWNFPNHFAMSIHSDGGRYKTLQTKVAELYLQTRKGKGEMPEWSNGAVSKIAVPGNRNRGFESLSLRQKAVPLGAAFCI